MSDETRLTLASVQPSVSGKYSCEVSADAPSFHTLIESGDLEVVGKCKREREKKKEFCTTNINFCIIYREHHSCDFVFMCILDYICIAISPCVRI